MAREVVSLVGLCGESSFGSETNLGSVTAPALAFSRARATPFNERSAGSLPNPVFTPFVVLKVALIPRP